MGSLTIQLILPSTAPLSSRLSSNIANSAINAEWSDWKQAWSQSFLVRSVFFIELLICNTSSLDRATLFSPMASMVALTLTCCRYLALTKSLAPRKLPLGSSFRFLLRATKLSNLALSPARYANPGAKWVVCSAGELMISMPHSSSHSWVSCVRCGVSMTCWPSYSLVKYSGVISSTFANSPPGLIPTGWTTVNESSGDSNELMSVIKMMACVLLFSNALIWSLSRSRASVWCGM